MSTLSNKLNGFYGTEGYHKITFFGRFVCTDGVRFFAEEGKAFWVLDLIASYQYEKKVCGLDFQHWKIVSKDEKFVITCDDGNGNVKVTQKGPTNLEEGTYCFFLCEKVLMLTSEY